MKTAREVIDDPALIVGVDGLVRQIAEGNMGVLIILFDGSGSSFATNLTNNDDITELLESAATDARRISSDREFVVPKKS